MGGVGIRHLLGGPLQGVFGVKERGGPLGAPVGVAVGEAAEGERAGDDDTHDATGDKRHDKGSAVAGPRGLQGNAHVGQGSVVSHLDAERALNAGEIRIDLPLARSVVVHLNDDVDQRVVGCGVRLHGWQKAQVSQDNAV